MKFFKTISSTFFLLVISVFCVVAQDENNVILRAMKDELKRSMEEIKYDNHDKPFFISYGITDSKNISVYATLGAIVQSSQFKNRENAVWNVCELFVLLLEGCLMLLIFLRSAFIYYIGSRPQSPPDTKIVIV